MTQLEPHLDHLSGVRQPVLPNLAVLTAAWILAGYTPWWLPPAVSPDDIRRGMLSPGV